MVYCISSARNNIMTDEKNIRATFKIRECCFESLELLIRFTLA